MTLNCSSRILKRWNANAEGGQQASIGDKDAEQLDLYERVKALEQGISARAVEREDSEEALFQEMLTGKPICTSAMSRRGCRGQCPCGRVKDIAASEGAGILLIGAAIEADIAELEDQEERDMFWRTRLEERCGMIRRHTRCSTCRRLHRREKEVRAWTARREHSASDRGGHPQDFEKTSSAEVMKYKDFVN